MGSVRHVSGRSENPSGLGVVVLPDNRGLSAFYERLTDRLAEQGHTALAIDYFGRSAGLHHRKRGDALTRMDHLMTHLDKLSLDTVHPDADVRVDGVDHLRAPDGGRCRAVVSLGFRLDGRLTSTTADARFGLSAVAGPPRPPGGARVRHLPGRPHGFFERGQDAFAEARQDTGRRSERIFALHQ